MNRNRDIALFNGTHHRDRFPKTAAAYIYEPATGKQTRIEIDPAHLKDAITVFQEPSSGTASDSTSWRPHAEVLDGRIRTASKCGD